VQASLGGAVGHRPWTVPWLWVGTSCVTVGKSLGSQGIIAERGIFSSKAGKSQAILEPELQTPLSEPQICLGPTGLDFLAQDSHTMDRDIIYLKYYIMHKCLL
jgi:hypothetical protein